jgi:hypothetical protein
MNNKRKAPYSHSDGSNCWTKGCSRGHRSFTNAINPAKLTSSDINNYLKTRAAEESKKSAPTSKDYLNFLQGGTGGYNWRSQITTRENDDHLLQHTAPDGSDPESYKQAHELTKIFPDDVLEHPDWYAGSIDKETVDTLKRIQGNPDAMVTIYRSAPKEVTHIQDGDWITLSKKYATEHGYQEDSADDWPVIEARVPARVIWTDGNDLNEFGISLIGE